LENKLSIIEIRLNSIEKRVGKIPDPFVLYYKPPNKEDYVKIHEYLNDVHVRLTSIESKFKGD
jgi:hypothetical protein